MTVGELKTILEELILKEINGEDIEVNFTVDETIIQGCKKADYSPLHGGDGLILG